MTSIPNTLAILDAQMRTIRTLSRVASDAYPERQYDALVAEHLPLVADCLARNNLIDSDSTLRLIAVRFRHIDVLLVELDSMQRVRRLVVVEDKLAKNPESRRAVLAQILDYAEKLQYKTEVATVLQACDEQTRRILESSRDDLSKVLRTGDFLLLVCGDHIQPDLVRLVEPFLGRDRYVASRFTLGLLSLALYRDADSSDEQLVLVPNVVGMIERSNRALELTVSVRTDDRAEVPAQIQLQEVTREAESPRQAPWDEASFFDRIPVANEDAWWPNPEEGLRNLLSFLKKHPSRFSIRWGKGKHVATFMVDSPIDSTTMLHVNECGRLDLPKRLGEILGGKLSRRIGIFKRRRGSESGDVKRTGWGICLGDETLDLNQPEHLELVCELLLGIADDLAQRQPE